jgi:hypothetical protein
LYCSHAKPVSSQLLNTVSTRFVRSLLYKPLALLWKGPSCVAILCKTKQN